jgi:hypothetical protein
MSVLLTLQKVKVLREPSFLLRPCRLARPRTPPFHGENTSSNLVGDANEFQLFQHLCRLTSFFGDSVVTK